MDLETKLFNKELMCSLIDVQADFINKSVQLTLCRNHCTDMTGAIKFSKRLMRDVRTIITTSGRKEDTVYMLRDGEWRSARYKCFT